MSLSITAVGLAAVTLAALVCPLLVDRRHRALVSLEPVYSRSLLCKDAALACRVSCTGRRVQHVSRMRVYRASGSQMTPDVRESR